MKIREPELGGKMMDINEKALLFAEGIAKVTLESADDYQQVGLLWKDGKALLKEVEEVHADDIDFAHREHRRLIAEKKKITDPLEQGLKRLKKLMANYEAEQERKRKAEQRRLEAEARKREEERQLQEAIEAEQAGDTEAAEEILEETITVPPVSAPAPAPKVDGVVMRTVWKFEIVDPAAIPREYLEPDEKKIGQVVRAMKANTNIPGIKVYSEKV